MKPKNHEHFFWNYRKSLRFSPNFSILCKVLTYFYFISPGKCKRRKKWSDLNQSDPNRNRHQQLIANWDVAYKSHETFNGNILIQHIQQRGHMKWNYNKLWSTFLEETKILIIMIKTNVFESYFVFVMSVITL